MLSDEERHELGAELARRRSLTVGIAACLALATLIALVSFPLWVAGLVAVLSAVVVAMVVARYKQILAAVRELG